MVMGQIGDEADSGSLGNLLQDLPVTPVLPARRTGHVEVSRGEQDPLPAGAPVVSVFRHLEESQLPGNQGQGERDGQELEERQHRRQPDDPLAPVPGQEKQDGQRSGQREDIPGVLGLQHRQQEESAPECPPDQAHLRSPVPFPPGLEERPRDEERGEGKEQVVAGQRPGIVEPAQQGFQARVLFPSSRLHGESEPLHQVPGVGQVPPEDQRSGHQPGVDQVQERALPVPGMDQRPNQRKHQEQDEGPLGQHPRRDDQTQQQAESPSFQIPALGHQAERQHDPPAERHVQEGEPADPGHQGKTPRQQRRPGSRSPGQAPGGQPPDAAEEQDQSREIGEEDERVPVGPQRQNHHFLEVVEGRVVGRE